MSSHVWITLTNTYLLDRS